MARVLEFQRSAEREVKVAVGWYRQRSRAVAQRLLDALQVAVDEILDNPERWPEIFDGVRFRAVKRFPYIVVYRFSDAAVQIVAVVHSKRREGYWKRRLKKPF